MVLMELRLDFPFCKSFSPLWNIYLAVFALKCFIYRHGVRDRLRLEVIRVMKSKVIKQPP